MLTHQSTKTSIPLTVKGSSSITSISEDKKIEGLRKERYTLIFDFETNDLPHETVVWDNFEPEDTIKKWSDGKPMKNKITGQPIPFPASDSSKWPHALQFCYVLYDNHLNAAKIVNEILRLPDGVIMSEKSEEIHHISLEQSRGKTKKIINPVTKEETFTFNPEIKGLLQEFMVDFKKANIIVAHNIRFDRNLLLAEMDRERKRAEKEDDYDTFIEFQEYINEVYSNKKEFCTANFGADVYKNVAINKIGKEYYKMPKLKDLYERLFGYMPDESKLHDALMDVIVCMRCFYKIRYDVDICNVEIDVIIREYIDQLSPENNKCNIGLIIEEIKEPLDYFGKGLETTPRKSPRLSLKEPVNYSLNIKNQKKQPNKKQPNKTQLNKTKKSKNIKKINKKVNKKIKENNATKKYRNKIL